MKFKGAPNALTRRRQHETNNFETEFDYEIEATKFTNAPCKSLDDVVTKQHAPRRSHIVTRESYEEAKLQRISVQNGHIIRPETVKQRDSVRRVGTAVNMRCCI